jgi:hypothetical protein
MTNASFEWESLLSTHHTLNGCELKAALFTTYSRTDERFLAEHLFPTLLKLRHESAGEGVERQCFLVELDQRLKRLHNKIIVVSSTATEEPDDPAESDNDAYSWIWRSIRRLTVGSSGRAVQHAKIWLFHWATQTENPIDYLEVVISSANLTRAAFKGQIQCAWRTCIGLNAKGSDTRLRSWGIVPYFLGKLAESAGDQGCLTAFVDLLARADCPKGVKFVASVPGNHSRKELRLTPWGAAGLLRVQPSGRGRISASILSPFIGSWSTDTLQRWCSAFGGSVQNLNVVWIDQNHPWARAQHWLIPNSTLKALVKSGATLMHLRHDPINDENADRFHDEQSSKDERWSHAKLYFFKRGNSRRLVITSANFSAAAWGTPSVDGALVIENFELGVCVEQVSWPFQGLQILDGETSAASISHLPTRRGMLIVWAQASWDGKTVTVNCRCQVNRDLRGEITSGNKSASIPKSKWSTSRRDRRAARAPWLDAKNPPAFVQLTCDRETINVPIFDERSLSARGKSLPSNLENVSQEIQDLLLFEQYGGRVVSDTEDGQEASGEPSIIPEPSKEVAGRPECEDRSEAILTTHNESYSVPTFELARRHLRIVDNWADQARRVANTAAREFEYVQHDGELLIEAFHRQANRDRRNESTSDIAAKIASEELKLLLKNLSEQG